MTCGWNSAVAGRQSWVVWCVWGVCVCTCVAFVTGTCIEPTDEFRESSDQLGNCEACVFDTYNMYMMENYADAKSSVTAKLSKFWYIDRCKEMILPCPGDDYGVVMTTRLAENKESCILRRRCAPTVSLPGVFRYREGNGDCSLCPQFSQSRSEFDDLVGHAVDMRDTCECKAGAAWDPDENACVLCAVGKYKETSGDIACDLCPAVTGTVAGRIGATLKSSCGSCSNSTFQIAVYKFASDVETTLTCEECPHTFATLKALVDKYYLADMPGERSVLNGKIQDENDFRRKFYWNSNACNPQTPAYNVGVVVFGESDAVDRFAPEFAIERIVCGPGESEERDTTSMILRYNDSTCKKCDAGKYKVHSDQIGHAKGQDSLMRCTSIVNCSMLGQGIAGQDPRIPYTDNRDAGETYSGTVGRTQKPICEKYPYIHWEYPVLGTGGNDTSARYTYNEHIEGSIGTHTRPCESKGSVGVGAIDWLLELWKIGEVHLPLETEWTESGVEIQPTCRVACRKGYEYTTTPATNTIITKQSCNQCVAGKAKPADDGKDNCTDDACRCQSCEAGTYNMWSMAHICDQCPPNFFCKGGIHVELCVNVGQSGRAGCDPDIDYLTNCVVGGGSANCLPCASPGSGVAFPGTSKSTWDEIGKAHCRGMCAFESGQFWDFVSSVCKNCTGIVNGNGWTGARACEPRCENGYFLLSTQQETTTTLGEYMCERCKTTYDEVCAALAVAGGDALYVVDGCSNNADTECLSCSDKCRVYEVPNLAAVRKTSDVPGFLGCTCECAPAAQGYWFYNVDESADLLDVGIAELQSYLDEQVRVHSTTLLLESTSNMCVRWRREAVGGLCESNHVMTLDPVHEEPSMVPAIWPTMTCKPWVRVCTMIGASLFAIPGALKLELTNYECHCQPGYYGLYTPVIDVLADCIPCPGVGSTSYAGTISVEGCYCAPGYARMRLSVTAEVAEICHPCSDHNLSRTNYYCPGGLVEPEGGIGTVITDSFMKTSMQPPYMLRTTADPHGTAQCRPQYTVRERDFAAFERDCVPEPGWTDEGVGGGIHRCDDEIEGRTDSGITLWDRSTGVEQCAHVCAHGTSRASRCRCDATRGYVRAVEPFFRYWTTMDVKERRIEYVFTNIALRAYLHDQIQNTIHHPQGFEFTALQWNAFGIVGISDQSYILVKKQFPSTGSNDVVSFYVKPDLRELQPSSCACAPGWYTTATVEGTVECAECLPGFYCHGGLWQPERCPVDMLSPRGTKSKRGCRCHAGYYRIRDDNDGEVEWLCIRCKKYAYCAAGCVTFSPEDLGSITMLGLCSVTSDRVSVFVNSVYGMTYPEYCWAGEQAVKKHGCLVGASRYILNTDTHMVTMKNAALLLNYIVKNEISKTSEDGLEDLYSLYNPMWVDVVLGIEIGIEEPNTIILNPFDVSLMYVRGPGDDPVMLWVDKYTLESTATSLETVFEYGIVHVAALQVLCGAQSVLVLRPVSARGSRLDNSTMCVDMTPYQLRVVHRALALPAQKTLGVNGFVDHASLVSTDELVLSEYHVPWSVVVVCNAEYASHANVTCESCDSNMGQNLRVTRVAAGTISGGAPSVHTAVVFLDTATQHFWNSTRDTLRYGSSASDASRMGALLFATVCVVACLDVSLSLSRALPLQAHTCTDIFGLVCTYRSQSTPRMPRRRA